MSRVRLNLGPTTIRRPLSLAGASVEPPQSRDAGLPRLSQRGSDTVGGGSRTPARLSAAAAAAGDRALQIVAVATSSPVATRIATRLCGQREHKMTTSRRHWLDDNTTSRYRHRGVTTRITFRSAVLTYCCLHGSAGLEI